MHGKPMLVENQYNSHQMMVESIVHENGNSFSNAHGIWQEHAISHNPQQNGVVERNNRTIL